jgi:hypothetical protein
VLTICVVSLRQAGSKTIRKGDTGQRSAPGGIPHSGNTDLMDAPPEMTETSTCVNRAAPFRRAPRRGVSTACAWRRIMPSWPGHSATTLVALRE